jgi:hypothetical protein
MEMLGPRSLASIFAVPLLAACSGALAGCSGAAPQLVELAPDDAGASTGTSKDAELTPAPGSGGGAGTGGGGGPGSGGGGAVPSGGGFDAGAAPAQCPAGATPQTSASGRYEKTATSFSTIACGTIAVGRTYWWTFTLPSSATTVGIAFSGNVQIEGTANGAAFPVSPGATLPFYPGDPYDLEITSVSSQPEPYVIVVTDP